MPLDMIPPALLLAIPIATVLISIRILMVLQNRKTDSKKNQPSRTTT